MSLFNRVGRALLSVIFILGGMEAFKNPGPRAPKAANIGMEPDEDLVKLNAAVMVAGGAMLATGIVSKLAALMLIASLIPTTLAGHAFWNEETEQGRKQQQTQFAKNLGLIGGLLILLATHDD